MLDLLKRLWYDRDDYIEFRGENILRRLKQQDAFKDQPKNFISIEPVSEEYVMGNSLAEAIETGKQRWGHMDFYCTPIDSPDSPSQPVPRSKLTVFQISYRGECIFRRLQGEGRLEGIVGRFIAIETKQGHYVVGDSWKEVIKKGVETWGQDRMYVRPIDNWLLP